MNIQSLKSRGGFTLIELLVVIGIIAVLASGVGIALRNKNPSATLKSAQSSLVGVLSAARSQAALNQADAMIVVQANPASDTFLRSVKVLVEKTAGSDDWKEVGFETILPEGVYIVPRSASSPFDKIALEDASKLSSFFVLTDTVKIEGSNTADKYMRSAKLTSLGGLSGAAVGLGGYMLVTVGTQPSATDFKFDNGTAVRGLVVSKYGIATAVDDASGL